MRNISSSLCADKGAKILFVAGGIAFPALARAEGMPQLEFGNWLVQAQVLWGALVFILFLLVLKLYFLPLISKVLTQRETQIEADLSYAKKAQKEAEDARREIEAEIHKSKLEAQKHAQQIGDSRRKKAKEQETQLRQQMEEKLQQALEKVDSSVQEIRQDLSAMVAPVAELIVGRCLNGSGAQQHHSDERQAERKSSIAHYADKISQI